MTLTPTLNLTLTLTLILDGSCSSFILGMYYLKPKPKCSPNYNPKIWRLYHADADSLTPVTSHFAVSYFAVSHFLGVGLG